ncbi:hypothetical protein D3C75_690000 [compost metagenome]
MACDAACQAGHRCVHRVGLLTPYQRLRCEGQEHPFLRAVLVGHMPCAGIGSGRTRGPADQAEAGQTTEACCPGQLGKEVATGRHEGLQGRTVTSS